MLEPRSDKRMVRPDGPPCSSTPFDNRPRMVLHSPLSQKLFGRWRKTSFDFQDPLLGQSEPRRAAPLCNRPSRLLVAWLSSPPAGICIP